MSSFRKVAATKTAEMEVDEVNSTLHAVRSESAAHRMTGPQTILTSEQQQVIAHPLGHHARVLAGGRIRQECLTVWPVSSLKTNLRRSAFHSATLPEFARSISEWEQPLSGNTTDKLTDRSLKKMRSIGLTGTIGPVSDR